MELGEADFLAELRESFHSAEVPEAAKHRIVGSRIFFPGNPGCGGFFLGGRVVGVGVLEDGLSMFFLSETNVGQVEFGGILMDVSLNAFD